MTDHVCRDIRLKRITREQGIKLVQEYQQKEPDTLNKFLEWVNLSKEEFMASINPFRDKRAWNENSKGQFILRDSIINHIDDEGIEAVRLKVDDPREYKLTELLEKHDMDDDYVLLGRAFIDENNFKAIEG